MSISAARVLCRMFGDIFAAIEAEKDHLTALDGAIGDADHGITMSLGFHAVAMRLAGMDLDQATGSTIFTDAAAAFLDAVGASSGPLYASAFLQAAKVLENNDRLSLANQAAIVEAMTAGIRQRGKGQRGDKTMLDAWIPAAEAAINVRTDWTDAAEMWTCITQAAQVGANATRSMVAARGRAARLGERSLGHIDPGAASAVIVLQAMMKSFVDVSMADGGTL